MDSREGAEDLRVLGPFEALCLQPGSRTLLLACSGGHVQYGIDERHQQCHTVIYIALCWAWAPVIANSTDVHQDHCLTKCAGVASQLYCHMARDVMPSNPVSKPLYRGCANAASADA